jgi:tetratricopeptide (TPR) repeat protein
MSVTRIVRLGIRFAAWITPQVKEWHRKRNLNLTEAERFLAARNWVDAEQHLVLALAERRHSTERQLDLLLKLVTARSNQAKWQQTEETIQMALGLADQRKDQAMRSRALASLVDVQLAQKKYSEAEQTIRAIEAIEAAQSTPDLARLALCSRKLGTALLNIGRTAEAFGAFQRAASLSEQAFGPNHEHTAQSLAELGMLSRQNGEHAEAQRCLRRALDIHRNASGPDSHESTQALYHLAASLEESGDLEGAAGEYERVLRLKERQVGGNRQEATDAQVRLAALYVKAGRIGNARELLLQAIGPLERKRGPELAQALEILAEVEDHMGHPAEAAEWRERAAEINTV